MFCQLVALRGWSFELADAISVFLRTGLAEEHRKLYTQGVKEMRKALGVNEGEALRILSAIYGLTNAVRIFWKGADRKFTEGAAENTGLEPCVWLVAEP